MNASINNNEGQTYADLRFKWRAVLAEMIATALLTFVSALTAVESSKTEALGASFLIHNVLANVMIVIVIL